MDIIPNISTGSKISQNSLADKIMKDQSLQKKEISSTSALSKYSNISSNNKCMGANVMDNSSDTTDMSIIRDCLNFN